MSESRIAKVKLVQESLEVHLEGSDDDTERKTAVKSLGSVHPDLSQAMQALEPHVRAMMCLPADWCANAFHVRSVSFSYSDNTGIDGVVISCSADLTTCKSPFFFNTPYMPIERHTEEGTKQEMSPEAIEALEKLKAEVQAYLNGKRVQADLFEEAA